MPAYYSPDYNPKKRRSKIKNFLRKAAGRSKETLVEAIGATLCAVTTTDAQGFVEHAGYRPSTCFGIRVW